MLDKEVIEPSPSEWASPVVFARKKDGTMRFCVDYRRLNAMTVPESYPIPRMDECLDSLGEAEIFSSLDCNWGYWQLSFSKADIDKTTFTSHYGTYRFKRMPFGLQNAPTTFQRAIDVVLASVKWQFALVYLDDIIVFSQSIDDHFDHLRTVLTLMLEAGFSLKLNKCFLLRKELEYLGHII